MALVLWFVCELSLSGCMCLYTLSLDRGTFGQVSTFVGAGAVASIESWTVGSSTSPDSSFSNLLFGSLRCKETPIGSHYTTMIPCSDWWKLWAPIPLFFLKLLLSDTAPIVPSSEDGDARPWSLRSLPPTINPFRNVLIDIPKCVYP